MKFSGTLPDGTETRSPKKYSAAWRGLAVDVEARLQLGLEAVGFDPGILFRRSSGRSLSLDAEVCRRIAAIPLPPGWPQPMPRSHGKRGGR